MYKLKVLEWPKAFRKIEKQKAKAILRFKKAKKISTPIKDKYITYTKQLHSNHTYEWIILRVNVCVIYWVMIIFARNIVGTV